MPSDSTGATPLTGVRVVEICSVAAGPYCSMLLSDMGADVIKIEPPDGDTLRQWPPLSEGFSENFASLNRNKRSIVLDLKNADDCNLARRLICDADVLVENSRAGALDRLGLGYASFAEDHPKLIYCSISAFGQAGPRATQGGFDLTIQAISGIMSVTGEPGAEPVKCGVPISDFATALFGAFAVASLLARVRAGGVGGHIDVSMLGASLAISALQTSEYFGTGADPRPLGAAHPRNAPYQSFRAQDGEFVLAAGNDKLWRKVCEVLARPELADEPRFATTKDRAAHQVELAGILNRTFSGRAVADVIETFERAGVPCVPINRYSQALCDPQVKFMEWVKDLVLPNGISTRTFATPIRIDGAASPIRSSPPALDGDRDAIIDELCAREGKAARYSK